MFHSCRHGIAIGCISLSRRVVRPFTAAEIQLVETFAAQAVIAIENVRQFREVQTAAGARGGDAGDPRGHQPEPGRRPPGVRRDPAQRGTTCAAPSMACSGDRATTKPRSDLMAHWRRQIGTDEIYDRWHDGLPMDVRHLVLDAIPEGRGRSRSTTWPTPPTARRSDPCAAGRRGRRAHRLSVPLVSGGRAASAASSSTAARSAPSPRMRSRLSKPSPPRPSSPSRTSASSANCRRGSSARRAATGEILEVISQSRDDDTPVFDVVLRNAADLCRARWPGSASSVRTAAMRSGGGLGRSMPNEVSTSARRSGHRTLHPRPRRRRCWSGRVDPYP